MEEHIREILKHLGEDPGRSGLERTPERVRESLEFLTSGYREDVEALLEGSIFEEEHDEMIIVKDISLRFSGTHACKPLSKPYASEETQTAALPCSKQSPFFMPYIGH